MAFFEDTEPAPTPVEQRLIDGISSSNTERLRSKLMEVILTERVPHAQARAVVVSGALFEPGALFDGFFDARALAVDFRSKQRLLDIDLALQPLYGYVVPAMTEQQVRGVDPVIINFWLDFFRKDNGLYRANVVAGLCISGALLDEDFVVTA